MTQLLEDLERLILNDFHPEIINYTFNKMDKQLDTYDIDTLLMKACQKSNLRTINYMLRKWEISGGSVPPRVST